jgi:hypothetical protein
MSTSPSGDGMAAASQEVLWHSSGFREHGASSNPATSNYTLELPDELHTHNIHPTFHFSQLKPHIPNDSD